MTVLAVSQPRRTNNLQKLQRWPVFSYLPGTSKLEFHHNGGEGNISRNATDM
jgi:hypothetical protein